MIWLLVFCALLVLALLFSLYCYYSCFYSPSDRPEDPYSLLQGSQYRAAAEVIHACTKVMDETPCQWVEIRSYDGLTLRGRYYQVREGAPLQILFHGYKSLSLRDCTGGFALSLQLGFNVLAVDQRAHASSQGHTISFGICERRDCLAWAEYAAERFGAQMPIILSGLSMGAATVLMASELPLPESVAGIIADSPYSTPAAIIRKVCHDRRIPEKLAYPFIRLGARLFGHFDLESSSALQAVGHAKVPILLLHGEDDRFVPCEMSEKILASCASPAWLCTFPGAGHGLCYIADRVRYEQAIVRFLWEIPALQPYLQENAFVQERLQS